MRRARMLGAGLLLAVLAATSTAASWHGGSAQAVLATIPVERLPCCLAVDPASGHVFVGNAADRSITMLDAHSGAVLHTTALGASPVRMAVDGRTRHLFVFTEGAALSMMMLSTLIGSVLGTVPYPYDTTGVAVDERPGYVLAVGVQVSGMGMFDARDGHLVRRVTGIGSAISVDVEDRGRRIFVPNAGGGMVNVLDAAGVPITQPVRVGAEPIAIAEDVHTRRVFVANEADSTVSVLDNVSGRVLNTVPVGTAPCAVAVAQRAGRVFVVNDGAHTVSVLDARTGAVIRTVALPGTHPDRTYYPNPVDVAVDERHDRVFVIHGSAVDPATGSPDSPTNDRVTVLDSRTGRLLDSVPVGSAPIALAIDEIRGRLFVLNSNIGCRPAGAWAMVIGELRQWLPWLAAPAPPVCSAYGTVTVIDTSRT